MSVQSVLRASPASSDFGVPHVGQTAFALLFFSHPPPQMASQQYVTPEAAEARINGLHVSYASASLTPAQRAQLDDACRQTREAVKNIYQQHMFNANSVVEQSEVNRTLVKLNTVIQTVSSSSAPNP